MRFASQQSCEAWPSPTNNLARTWYTDGPDKDPSPIEPEPTEGNT